MRDSLIGPIPSNLFIASLPQFFSFPASYTTHRHFCQKGIIRFFFLKFYVWKNLTFIADNPRKRKKKSNQINKVTNEEEKKKKEIQNPLAA